MGNSIVQLTDEQGPDNFFELYPLPERVDTTPEGLNRLCVRLECWTHASAVSLLAAATIRQLQKHIPAGSRAEQATPPPPKDLDSRYRQLGDFGAEQWTAKTQQVSFGRALSQSKRKRA